MKDIERIPTEKEYSESIESDEGIDTYLSGKRSSIEEKRAQVEQKLALKNRQILKNSDDPIAECKNLTCIGCFLKESRQEDIVDLDAPLGEIFKNYTGRMHLKKLQYLHYNVSKIARADLSILFKFDVCDFCGKKFSISIQDAEFKEGVFDKMIVASQKFEIDDPELNF